MRKFQILVIFSFLNSINFFSQEFLKEFVSINEFIKAENQSFFIANDGVHGEELWRTDGTKEGTTLVKGIYKGATSSSVSNLFYYNNKLYFSANDGIYGQELWVTDGKEENTKLLKNIYTYVKQSSNPRGFVAFENEIYFLAADDNISGYQDIWKTDGTESGTIKIYEANTSRGNLFVANNLLYFTQGTKLYKVNLSNNSLIEINVDEYYSLSEFNVFNDEIYFISHTNYRQNIRLYRIDKDENLVLLKEYNQPQYGDIDIDNFTYLNSHLYYSIRTDFNSSQDTDVLWKTDGTAANTKAVKSFGWDRHYSGSHISNFTIYKDKIYFNGGSKNGFKMWASDGTTEGTLEFLKQQINSSLNSMFVYNSVLYYRSSSYLYQTDGISDEIVKNNESLISSKNSDDLFDLKVGHNTIYFEGATNNDSKKGLFTIDPSPSIEIKENSYKLVKNFQPINFTSKVDSLSKKTITITNKGNKELAISSIKIEGDNFFINNISNQNITQENPNGTINQIIKPKSSSSFEIGFYPNEIEIGNANLLIKSNDTEFFNFNIILKGIVDEGEVLQAVNTFPLDKEIEFNQNSLILDNTTIIENSSLKTTLGNFSAQNNVEYNFYFVAGEGDNNNKDFIIENNILKSNKIFDYEIEHTLSIRVKAILKNGTGNHLEENFIIDIVNENEDISDECALSIRNLSYGLKDVETINDNTVIAIGDSGKILKSFDKGTTWKNIELNIPNTLYNIQFINSDLGYINGDKILLKTVDSGENWFKVSYPAESYPYPNKMTFLNTEIGFIYGDDGKLYTTNNGGKTWEYRQLGYDDINDVEFFDENNGVLCFNSKSLLKTDDGGLSWKTITIDFPELSYNTKFVKLELINKLVGYLVGYNGEIMKTEDAGETWEFKSKIITSYPTDFKFIDENTGYLLSGFNWGYIHKTIDGGNTWSEIDFERTGSLTSISFLNDDNAVLVGHGVGFGSTSENGHSIFKVNLSNDKLELQSSLGGDAYYSSMDFSKNLGLILSNGQYSGNNDSRRTIDNGVTWQKINLPEVEHEDYNECFIKNDKFYILGSQYIYISTDFGETFNKIENPELKKIFWVDNNTVYGYSYDGFYTSNDAGNNWIKSFDFVDYQYFNDIYFINANKGYLLAYNGYFVTEDGGKNFTFKKITQQNDQDNIYLNTIFFKDEMNGIIGNQDGLVYTTANAGETWKRQINLMRSRVTQLENNNQNYYAISTNGGGYTKLFKSLDNGENWQEEINFGEDFKSIKEFNNTLYLIGDRGAFYKYGKQKSVSTPGYIEGKINVSKNTSSSYFVNQDYKTNYKWSVTGNNIINYYNNVAEINWKESGEFTISVTPYNNCLEGLSKEIKVKVYPETSPKIIGSEEVKGFTNEKYFTNLNVNSSYLWSVQGDESFIENDNEIEINWGEIGDGNITVVETNTLTKSRVKSTLSVKIKDVLKTDQSILESNILIYPVPAFNEVQIDYPVGYSISKKDIKIYDLLGKQQSFSSKAGLNKYYLNISNLKLGMYFLKINIESKVISKKIVKTKN